MEPPRASDRQADESEGPPRPTSRPEFDPAEYARESEARLAIANHFSEPPQDDSEPPPPTKRAPHIAHLLSFLEGGGTS